MKILQYGLVCIASCMINIANAEVMTMNLSQENKQLKIVLKKGDTLSVNYNFERHPIYRYSEWYYYAMRCTTSERSNIEYMLEDKTQTKFLPILLSPHGDRQDIGSNINPTGTFKIKNSSEEAAYINCELYNKYGM